MEQPTTLIQFLQAVDEIKRELVGDHEVWYRGQSDASYRLLPGLLRYENGLLKEEALFRKFRQNAYKLIERKNNDWETLFDMQHYGVPTRLLDWTDTLGVALFFATYYNIKNDIQNDAALYILDPLILNRRSRISSIPFLPHDPKLNYKMIYWEKNPFAPTYPIAIEPDYANDRIKAQTGKFTIHGDDLTSIEELCPEAVKKVVVPKSISSEILQYLSLFNINSNAIYPDMHGMVDYINDIAGLKKLTYMR